MPISDHPIVDLFDNVERASPSTPTSAIASVNDDPEEAMEKETKSMRDSIIDILSDFKWFCLAVVRLGFPGLDDSQNIPTVAIIVLPDSNVTVGEALDVACKVADYVYQFEQLYDVAVEVLSMDISPLHDTRVSEFMADIKYTFEDAFDDSPSIGVSIENPSGNSGVGTLGGYLRVSGRATASSIDVPDSKIKYMALTCHHVLTKNEAPYEFTTSGQDIEPFVNCPSFDDFWCWQQDLSLSDMEKNKDLRRLREMRYKGSRMNARQQNILRYYEAKYIKTKPMIEKLEKFDIVLGNVYCSSGVGAQAVSSKHSPESFSFLMDWGLVELSASRLETFTKMSSGLCNSDFDAFAKITHYDRSLVPPWRIQSLQELKESLNPTANRQTIWKDVVCKVGKKTGRTFGVLNQIHPSMNVRSSRNGEEKSRTGRTVLVLVPKAALDDTKTFGSPGDSGSLVYDYEGKIMGIYFGGQRYEPYNPPIEVSCVDGLHFVAPIAPTLESIQAVVKTDPAFSGYDVEVEFLWADENGWDDNEWDENE